MNSAFRQNDHVVANQIHIYPLGCISPKNILLFAQLAPRVGFFYPVFGLKMNRESLIQSGVQ